MKDVIIDTLIDALKIIPFLFIAFLVIELIEHKFSNKTKKIISKSGRFGPIIGSLLGAIPQCGFSVLASNLYVTRIVTMGTLISIYLSTSDEMIPILLSNNIEITKIINIIVIKVLVGMICGFIIDLIFKRKNNKDFHICDEDNCDCNESIIKSSAIHTLKTLSFIIVISFILNIAFKYIPNSTIEKMFLKNSIFAPFISSIIGLIPNCGASIAITELYINNVISLGTTIGGLLTGSGVALIVLFKTNKNIKENLIILAIIYLVGVLVGTLINVIGI